MDTKTTMAPGPAQMRAAIETRVAAARARRSHYLGAVLRRAFTGLLERAPRAGAVARAHPLGA